MLRTRLWTAAFGLPITLAIVLWAPPLAFTIFIAFLTVWALYEVITMTRIGVAEALPLLVIAVVVATAVMANPHGPLAVLSLFGPAEMIRLVFGVAQFGPERERNDYMYPVVGGFWVGGLFPYLALLRNRAGGIAEIILIFLMVIVSDSGAYFAGRAFGRHKLAPRVSPNKTVEGAFGGLAGTVAAALILRPLLASGWSWGATVIIAAGVSVLAQAGDLANSAYKRVAGVKDSGWIFPGHGGLLDRVCGLLFAAAFAYYATS